MGKRQKDELIITPAWKVPSTQRFENLDLR